ncbi:hypothetical protein N0V90_012856 [Kalmusia sp. IMI 367209]|nr:hypothetical protein N0V90_012856 [Kalmusia sp. IMI 367209]
MFSNLSFPIWGIANNVIGTPRYVGTTSREDPRKRGTHHNRATSLAENFDAKLSQLFPALSSKRIVYLIKDSALERQPKDCSLIACVEALEPLARMPLAKPWGPDKPLLDVEDRQLRILPVHASLSGTLTTNGEVVGIPKAVQIKNKAIATKACLDKRTAEFDLERITIRDKNGNTPHSVRRFLCESEDLKALWDDILGTTDVVAPPESVPIMPANKTQLLYHNMQDHQ